MRIICHRKQNDKQCDDAIEWTDELDCVRVYGLCEMDSKCWECNQQMLVIQGILSVLCDPKIVWNVVRNVEIVMNK